VLSQPVAILLRQYEWIAEARWGQTVEQITSTEVGVMRVLARAFSKEKLPELPDFDEVLEEHKPKATQPQLPDWMQKFEQANRDRPVRPKTG